jgi:hypothetical protein
MATRLVRAFDHVEDVSERPEAGAHDLELLVAVRDAFLPIVRVAFVSDRVEARLDPSARN